MHALKSLVNRINRWQWVYNKITYSATISQDSKSNQINYQIELKSSKEYTQWINERNTTRHTRQIAKSSNSSDNKSSNLCASPQYTKQRYQLCVFSSTVGIQFLLVQQIQSIKFCSELTHSFCLSFWKVPSFLTWFPVDNGSNCPLGSQPYVMSVFSGFSTLNLYLLFLGTYSLAMPPTTKWHTRGRIVGICRFYLPKRTWIISLSIQF